MNEKEIRREIRELRADMKAKGLRIISFMNGGQSLEQMRANERLFELKLRLCDVTGKKFV
jgi:hypothetical protein